MRTAMDLLALALALAFGGLLGFGFGFRVGVWAVGRLIRDAKLSDAEIAMLRKNLRIA